MNSKLVLVLLILTIILVSGCLSSPKQKVVPTILPTKNAPPMPIQNPIQSQVSETIIPVTKNVSGHFNLTVYTYYGNNTNLTILIGGVKSDINGTVKLTCNNSQYIQKLPIAESKNSLIYEFNDVKCITHSRWYIEFNKYNISTTIPEMDKVIRINETRKY